MTYPLPSFAQDENIKTGIFLRNCLLASALAMLLGALLDNAFLAARDDAHTGRGWSTLFFCGQLALNILFLFALCRYSIKYLYWIQLSFSGLLFSVLFFISQSQLSSNVSEMTRFR